MKGHKYLQIYALIFVFYNGKKIYFYNSLTNEKQKKTPN